MSARLLILKASEVIKVLENIGFNKIRTKGSHIFFKHSDGRATLVPRHGREDIGKGLLRQIIREIEITPEEFAKLLE